MSEILKKRKSMRHRHSEKDGAVFCLAEAPSKEAFAAVHREAQGLEADEIFEVTQGDK